MAEDAQLSLPTYEPVEKPQLQRNEHSGVRGYHPIEDRDDTNDTVDHGVGRIGSSLNMVNTVVGGGISLIATPAAVRYLGLFWFLFFEIFFAIVTGLSMYLLIDLADQTQLLSIDELVPTVHSYSKPSQYISTRRIYDSHVPSNATHTSQRKWYFTIMSKLISAITALNCFGVVVAFLVTMNDVLTNIFSIDDSNGSGGGGGILTDEQYYGFIVVPLIIIIFLLNLIDDIGSMEYLSLISMFLCIVFMIILIFNCILLSINSNMTIVTKHIINFNINKGVSAIILSWACQFNMLPTYESLRPKNKRRIYSIHTTYIMCFIALIIYIVEGIASYYSFVKIEDNIIDNIDPKTTNDVLGVSNNVARIGMLSLSFANYLTVPLFFVEMRHRALHFANLSEHLPGIYINNTSILL